MIQEILSAEEYALPEAPLHKIVAAAASIRVLLVEDDPEAADLVQLTLSGDRIDPFDVEWACNLAEAMIRLSQPGIDVVLLDLGLPELSGYKSLRVIESACEHKLPVVIFTADDRGISRNLTLGLGASDYLLKHEASPAQVKQSLRNAVLNGRPQ
jgi:two-component system catabolic regulation response regulator CreB